MKTTFKLTISVLMLTAGTFSLPGCEDSAATQRDDVQARIVQISSKLQKALANPAGGTSEDLASVQALDGVLADLNSISEGEPGQAAAKALMAATALREIATIHLNRALDLEAQLRADRAVVAAKIAAAGRIDAQARGLDQIDARESNQQLQADLQAAQQRLNELRATIGQLEAPITQQTNLNAADAEEVEKLRLEVAQLLRQAQELGFANGFETYQRAASVDRQADRIEYEIAQREIELQYSLTPEHELAAQQVAQLVAMSQSLTQAQQQLQAFASASQADAKARHDAVTAMKSQIDSRISEIESLMSGELNEAYEQALDALQKAGSQAQKAAAGAAQTSSSGRLMAARVHETQGRAFAAQARALSDHQFILSQYAAMGGSSKTQSQQNAAAAAHAQAIENAKQAFTQAQEQLNAVQVRNDPGAVDAFRQNLEKTLAAIEGRTVSAPSAATMPVDDMTSTQTPATSGAAASSARGFDTLEALVQFMDSNSGSIEGARLQLEACIAETPDGKRLMQMTRDTVEAQLQLDQALREKFNQGVLDDPTMKAMVESGGIPKMSSATIAEQTDDRVKYSVTVQGQTLTVGCRKVNGLWYYDMDYIDPQFKPMLPMLEMMTGNIKRAATQVAGRIRNDEFASAEEAMQAFQMAMGGMGGGGMGGGGGAMK